MVVPFWFNIEKYVCSCMKQSYCVRSGWSEEKKKTQWNQQKVQFRARSLIHLHDLHANENEKNATFVCVCVFV